MNVVYVLVAHLVLSLSCAVAVYERWRRRLGQREVFGALIMGQGWFLVWPMVVRQALIDRRTDRGEAH
jgi:hypothetical protein